MFLDVNGLIVQADGDGGDKLQREGFWDEGCFNNPTGFIPVGMADYSRALLVLTDANGNLLRDEITWTDPKDVSRDQLVSNIRACGYRGYGSVLDRVFHNVVRNWSRYPNGDIAAPNDYGRFIRAYNKKLLYPLLWITDLQLLGSTIFSVALSYLDITGRWWSKDKFVGDDLNMIGDLKQSKLRLPTPFSWLARKIFRYLRAGGPMYGLNVYFRPETGANPEFIQLWQYDVERL